MSQAPAAPNAAERSTGPVLQDYWYAFGDHAIAEQSRDRRLASLPEHCRMLLGHLHNDEDDAELVFVGLAFADVMRAAETSPDVFFALRRLTDTQLRRLARQAA